MSESGICSSYGGKTAGVKAGETVTVLLLAEDSYVDHGVYRQGQQGRSVCLPDRSLDVTSVFDAR